MLTKVWAALLGLTVVEVALIYPRLSPPLFLIVLVALSIGKSALIIAYFMHLKFERRAVTLLLFPLLLVFILVLLVGILPDAAYGQCSQCFRTAAAQQEAGRNALNLGILTLLIPVFGLLAGFCLIAWRRREP